jgi:hypothetical protein
MRPFFSYRTFSSDRVAVSEATIVSPDIEMGVSTRHGL